MLAPVRTVAPAAIATAAEARALLGTSSADDARLTSCLAAVTARLDGWEGELWRCVGSQTWRQGFFDWDLRLQLGEAQSITSVKYIDTAGAEQTVAASNYYLRGDRIVLKPGFTYPALDDVAEPVTVTYVAGFASVPEDLKTAIIRAAGALFYSSGRDPGLKAEQIPGVASFTYGVGTEHAGKDPDAEAVFARYRLARL